MGLFVYLYKICLDLLDSLCLCCVEVVEWIFVVFMRHLDKIKDMV